MKYLGWSSEAKDRKNITKVKWAKFITKVKLAKFADNSARAALQYYRT